MFAASRLQFSFVQNISPLLDLSRHFSGRKKFSGSKEFVFNGHPLPSSRGSLPLRLLTEISFLLLS